MYSGPSVGTQILLIAIWVIFSLVSLYKSFYHLLHPLFPVVARTVLLLVS